MTFSSLPNERDLFIRISEGDESAFSTCYIHYTRQLLPSLMRLLGSRESAEEVLQEVFLKVWLFRDRLAEVENPTSWLFRVTANTARDWLKIKMRARQRIAESGRMAAAQKVSSQEQTDLKALSAVIQRTIRAFPSQRRRIYEMSREEGLKPSEIAARLQLSVSTVKNTLLAALKAIRENVEEAGFWTVFMLFFLKK